MPRNVAIMAILNLLGGLACLIGGGVLAAGLLDSMVGALALPVAVAVLLVAPFHLSCAYGLAKMKPFGRIIQLGFSWPGLAGFPAYTAFSALILHYLRRPDVRAAFASGSGAEVAERPNDGWLGVAMVLCWVGWIVEIVGLAILLRPYIPGLS